MGATEGAPESLKGQVQEEGLHPGEDTGGTNEVVTAGHRLKVRVGLGTDQALRRLLDPGGQGIGPGHR